MREYGFPEKGNKELCERCLMAEVATYDSYLCGDCWYLTVEKDGEEVENIGGFIGDIDKCGISEYVPEEARYLLDNLEWINDWR